MTSAPAALEPRPAADLGRPTFHKAHSNQRSETMFVPICTSDPETGFEGCQDAPGAKLTLWWKGCIAKGHDPFYSIVKHIEERPILVEMCATCDKAHPENVQFPIGPPPEVNAPEEEQNAYAERWADYEATLPPRDHEFVGSGRHLLGSTETFVYYREQPNLKQVQLTPRTSGTLYGFDPITWRRGNGYLLVTEHPTKPLLPFCSYYNCWSQKVTVQTEWGGYCNRDGAARVSMDLRGKAIETVNDEILRDQLDSVRIG